MFQNGVQIAFSEHQAEIKYVNGLTKFDPRFKFLFGIMKYRKLRLQVKCIFRWYSK